MSITIIIALTEPQTNIWSDIERKSFRRRIQVRLAKRLSSSKIESAKRVQILGDAVCISLFANTFGKGMNPFVLSPTAMSK